MKFRNEIAYQTEALYKHMEENGNVSYYDDGVNEEEVLEDKYFIYPEKYHHYGGKMYTWLGDDKHEAEYIVFNEDKIEDGAREVLKDRIDELGYDGFSEWLWEDNLDEDAIRNYLREYYSEMVYEEPESWGVEKELSDQQEKIITIYTQKIEKLNKELQTGDSKKINSEIEDIRGIIDDIRENPEGGYNEDEIERAIEHYIDEYVDDFPGFLREMGFDKDEIMNFVDVDGVIDYIIRNDDWGDIFGSYDGGADEYNINGHIYIVMRYN